MRISLLFLLFLSFFQKLDKVRRGACMGDISRPCILVVCNRSQGEHVRVERRGLAECEDSNLPREKSRQDRR